MPGEITIREQQKGVSRRRLNPDGSLRFTGIIVQTTSLADKVRNVTEIAKERLAAIDHKVELFKSTLSSYYGNSDISVAFHNADTLFKRRFVLFLEYTANGSRASAYKKGDEQLLDYFRKLFPKIDRFFVPGNTEVFPETSEDRILLGILFSNQKSNNGGFVSNVSLEDPNNVAVENENKEIIDYIKINQRLREASEIINKIFPQKIEEVVQEYIDEGSRLMRIKLYKLVPDENSRSRLFSAISFISNVSILVHSQKLDVDKLQQKFSIHIEENSEDIEKIKRKFNTVLSIGFEKGSEPQAKEESLVKQNNDKAESISRDVDTVLYSQLKVNVDTENPPKYNVYLLDFVDAYFLDVSEKETALRVLKSIKVSYTNGNFLSLEDFYNGRFSDERIPEAKSRKLMKALFALLLKLSNPSEYDNIIRIKPLILHLFTYPDVFKECIHRAVGYTFIAKKCTLGFYIGMTKKNDGSDIFVFKHPEIKY